MTDQPNKSAADLLKAARLVTAPETFAVVRLSERQWTEVLSDPAASPRMSAPFMIFKDPFEITLVLDETDLGSLTRAVPEAQTERGYRLLTFDVVLGFGITGVLAEITRVLALHGIPVLALSSFSRDHLLIKQVDLARSLIALGELVDEVC